MTNTKITDANELKWTRTRPGESCAIRVAATQTSGAYSIVEVVSSPGDSTPLHVHENDDEHYVILEGIARMVCGDTTFDAAAGMAVTFPRNIPHAWGNVGDTPLRMLVTSTPGGSEESVRMIDDGMEIDLPTLEQRFGVRVVGPMLLDPSE
jgi:mannose-6-phosphate isomerase-like protein (cupin superfamily)